MMENEEKGMKETMGEVFTEEEIIAGYADNFDWDLYESEKQLDSWQILW